jgi:hypothetical protein
MANHVGLQATQLVILTIIAIVFDEELLPFNLKKIGPTITQNSHAAI